MAHSKHADEYCTYSEVFDGRNDRFCSVIREVTDSSVDSYSSESSDTSQSDEESDEEQRTVINRGFHGFRPPGIPSCIEEQNEECSEDSSSDGTEKFGFQNEKEHSFTL